MRLPAWVLWIGPCCVEAAGTGSAVEARCGGLFAAVVVAQGAALVSGLLFIPPGEPAGYLYADGFHKVRMGFGIGKLEVRISLGRMYPPTNWEEFREWLDKVASALSYLPADHLPQFFEQFDNCDDAIQWWLEAERPFFSEIERAVERISIGEAAGFPVPAQLAEGFLRERIGQAIEWTETLSTKRGTPVDFPDMPPERFFRWLLLEWWMEQGIGLRVEWHLVQQNWC